MLSYKRSKKPGEEKPGLIILLMHTAFVGDNYVKGISLPLLLMDEEGIIMILFFKRKKGF
jgi:hypothetical protein